MKLGRPNLATNYASIAQVTSALTAELVRMLCQYVESERPHQNSGPSQFLFLHSNLQLEATPEYSDRKQSGALLVEYFPSGTQVSPNSRYHYLKPDPSGTIFRQRAGSGSILVSKRQSPPELVSTLADNSEWERYSVAPYPLTAVLAVLQGPGFQTLTQNNVTGWLRGGGCRMLPDLLDVAGISATSRLVGERAWRTCGVRRLNRVLRNKVKQQLSRSSAC